MAPKKKRTPVRLALKEGSSLQLTVMDGLGALTKPHRALVESDLRTAFGDSLDLDAALAVEHPNENRWDYLVGHAPSAQIVGVEPHSAKDDQITTVINKRNAAKDQLAAHLRAGARVSVWLWVASGKVCFADTEKARRRLDENGIRFVGSIVLAKHLPGAKPKSASRKVKR